MLWDTLNENDDDTRSRLESNDRYTQNVVLRWQDVPFSSDSHDAARAACERDGLLIGRCSSLRRLILFGRGMVPHRANGSDRFEVECCELMLKGIALNRSIEELRIVGDGPVATCNGRVEAFVHFFSILLPFLEHNHKLHRLEIAMNWNDSAVIEHGTQQLVAALEKCRSLKDFQLKCSRSEEAQHYGGEIFTALKNSRSNLTKLSLDGAAANWNGCAELGELIQSSPLMEELDISQNAINDEGAAVLGRVLGGSTSLKKVLFMRSIAMTPAGWRAFYEFLKSPNSALEELELGAGHNDDTILALTDALEQNTSLKMLRLCKSWELTPRGWCSFFANVLGRPNSALEHLTVNHCGSMEDVDDGIARELANALDGDQTLRALDLGGFGSISREGWLTFISSVQNLLFGTESLGAVISSNHTLFKLILEEDHQYTDYLSLPEDLVHMLWLNRNDNKEEAVQGKIRRYYQTCNPTDEDDELLIRKLMRGAGDLDIKVLPLVLAWAGRDRISDTLLYRLFRRDPAVFGPANGSKSTAGKRKR